jgi:hypothetical protein
MNNLKQHFTLRRHYGANVVNGGLKNYPWPMSKP